MAFPHPIPWNKLRTLLRDWGYSLHRREDGWTEVLLARQEERWLGRGATEQEAFEDCVRQAFPSAASLFALLAASLREGREAPGPADAPAAEAPTSALPSLPIREVSPPAPWEPARRPTTEVAAALAELENLSEHIESDSIDLSLEPPRRQRLQILEWCANVRHIESQAMSPVVETAGSRVIRKLRALCSRWWPGNVTALRQTSLPFDCRHELPGLRGKRGVHWGDVAEAAAAELESQFESGEGGWADEGCLHPPHPDAEGMLNRIANLLVELTGNLEHPPQAGSELAGGGLAPERTQELANLAEHLRWLRGGVADAWRWGLLMGRLRWICDSLPRDQARDLLRALDPSWAPNETWAERFEFDPEKRALQEARREHLRNAPRPGESAGVLLAWILRAGEIKIDASRIARELEPVREETLGIDEALKANLGRRERRRLRRVQDLLRGVSALDAEEGEAQPEDAVPDKAEAPAPLDELMPQILLRTRGRTALFVANRSDVELDRELIRTFEFLDLDRVDATQPGKLQSAVERVAQRHYEVVLSATGFQSHSAESKLKRVVREADVLYVSVNRGRRGACIRALARELGLIQRPGRILEVS